MTTRPGDARRRPNVNDTLARRDEMSTELETTSQQRPEPTTGPTNAPPLSVYAAGTSLPPLRHNDDPCGPLEACNDLRYKRLVLCKKIRYAKFTSKFARRFVRDMNIRSLKEDVHYKLSLVNSPEDSFAT